MNTKLFLASGTWQGVAGIASILALLFAMHVWYNQTAEIAVASVGISGLEPISAKAEKEDREGTFQIRTLETVVIRNKGVRAVKPSDFLSPLSIYPKGRKIDVILKCPAIVLISSPIPMRSLSWKSVDGHWEADNPLLNPGEWICVHLGFAESFYLEKQLNNFKVDARVADTKIVHYEDFNGFVRGDLDYLLVIAVTLMGHQVYLFLAIQTLLFLLNLLLYEQSGIAEDHSMKYRAGLLLILFFSTASAESIVYVAGQGTRHVHGLVMPILLLHAVFLLYCAWKSAAKLVRHR